MKICDICGSVLRKAPYQLLLRPTMTMEEFTRTIFGRMSAPDCEEEWKAKLNLGSGKSLEAEICSTCAELIPKAIEEIKKKVIMKIF